MVFNVYTHSIQLEFYLYTLYIIWDYSIYHVNFAVQRILDGKTIFKIDISLSMHIIEMPSPKIWLLWNWMYSRDMIPNDQRYF